MGREVRRVPADWQHPKDEKGNFIPLHDGYNRNVTQWDEENEQWALGFRRSWENDGFVPKDAEHEQYTYVEWTDERPLQEDYMPDFPVDQRTHWQMYEDTSEGTPISPVFATPEELAHWLADNQASSFANMTATYEQWLGTINRGSAVSMVVDSSGMRSGVEAAI